GDFGSGFAHGAASAATAYACNEKILELGNNKQQQQQNEKNSKALNLDAGGEKTFNRVLKSGFFGFLGYVKAGLSCATGGVMLYGAAQTGNPWLFTLVLGESTPVWAACGLGAMDTYQTVQDIWAEP
ncbi:MAG: hypothetical protein WA126_12415, partial [Thermodesulfovibrionales bacterium]